MELTLTLTADETAFIIKVLGQLPTESNVWPLKQKLAAQFDTQTKQEAAPAEAAAA